MSDPIVEPVVHDVTAVLHHSVAAGMPLLLLLDFDGTLVELAPEPDAIVVPAGAHHNLINTGDKPLRLYTIYGPPNHVDKLLEHTKAEAETSREVFDGVTSE